MSEKQNTSEASVTRFELKANNAVWELIIGKIFRGEQGDKGDKGENGEKGEAGYTPVKGVDYWTPEEAAAIETAKQAANDAAAKADKAATDATTKVEKAVEDIQINWDSKQDKLSAENPVQTEQIADNAISASKLSADVATAIGKIPQLEESVSVNNTSIENLGADVQELRENMQEKQDKLSADNPVQTEQIAEGAVNESKIADKAVTESKLSEALAEVVSMLNFPPISLDIEEGDEVKGWTSDDFNRIVSLWNKGISPRLNVETVPSHVVDVNSKDSVVYIASEGVGVDSESETDPTMMYSLFRTCLSLKDGKVVYGGYTIYAKYIQSAFDVDDSLQYEQADLVAESKNAKLGVKDKGVTLPKLSADVQSIVKQFNLPPIIKRKGTQELHEWTSDDFNRCVKAVSDGTFLQTTIDGKAATIDGYDENENIVTFNVIQSIADSSVTVRKVSIGMLSSSTNVLLAYDNTATLNFFIHYELPEGVALKNWTGTNDDFTEKFGMSFSDLLAASAVPVILSATDSGEKISLQSVACQTGDTMQSVTFTDGTVFIRISSSEAGGDITITSKQLLTEEQYNALNNKVGDIDVALTSIMGE